MQPTSKAGIAQTAPFAVRPMESEDVSAVAAILTDVFADNPVYRLIFRTSDTKKGLRWLFERNLLLNQRHGTVKVICLPAAPRQIVGTFSLTPADADAPSVIEYVKLGVLGMPFRFGLPALLRMFSLMNQNEQKIAAAVNVTGCWYLGLVAVAKPHRSRGIASGALAQGFAELEGPSRVVLSTQLESNVRLYTRLGFQVLAEDPMEWRQNRVQNWVMGRNVVR